MKYILKLSVFIFCIMFSHLSAYAKPYIEIQQGVDGKIGGAAIYQGKTDVKNSPYFKTFDFYNSKPSKSLLILKNFQTYQQTSEYTCGEACAIMALNYMGYKNLSEDKLAKEADARNKQNPRDDYSYGTSTEGIIKIFQNRNIKTESSINLANKSGKSFSDCKKFANYIKHQLKNNNPIIVENITYGGHWMIIIGYDNMGTEQYEDDILVFADPYDVGDHHQDGYCIKNFVDFFDEWFDKSVLPQNQNLQQFVTVYTKR